MPCQTTRVAIPTNRITDEGGLWRIRAEPKARKILEYQDVVLHTETIDENVLREMNHISAGIQRKACALRPHHVWDIIANEIPRLLAKCEEEKIPFLWDGLGPVFKKLAGVELSEDDVSQFSVRHG